MQLPFSNDVESNLGGEMKVTRRLLEASVAACLLGGACPSEAAMLFNFPDFSSTAGLTLVGSATPDGNQLQIGGVPNNL